MAFCSYSKEFYENTQTMVENKFIEKYLPEADGFFVKVYLYGLYLCGKKEDFSVCSMAEVLKTTEEKILSAFLFWQDYDLVEVLSKSPLIVQYLPVRVAAGRPKKIAYEQYADFNKQLARQMQQVGRYVTYSDSVKFMNFLQENDMQPLALLLIVEYCISKQGEKVSPSYIFNKAKKFIASGKHTYEQVEKELSSYNANEKDVEKLFDVLNIKTKADETDYAAYQKWTEELGFDKKAVLTAAKRLKRGGMDTLGRLLDELAERGKTQADELENYLILRDELASLTFKIAKKLGVKVGNPAAYIDEYVEKWYGLGYGETALIPLAGYCMKTDAGDFSSLDTLVKELFKTGVVSDESVAEYLAVKTDELKLFGKIRAYLGGLKYSKMNLSLVETWRGWNFSDEMILEAAKRSASSAAPIPYMNKILSDWKREGVFTPAAIPEHKTSNAPDYRSAQVKALDERSDREHFYAARRDEAQKRADAAIKKAQAHPLFKEICQKLSKMEMSLAQAELRAPETLPALQAEKAQLTLQKQTLLQQVGLTEEMLVPQYSCKRCSDTGFLKNGAACNCYGK